MASRHKRKLADADPTASDPEDLDYGDQASPRRSRKSKASPRKQKRRRERYGDSDDDIEVDSVSSDQESFAASDDVSEVEERHPITGRGVRSAAKKTLNYGEVSSEEEARESSDSDRDPLQPTPRAGSKRAAPRQNSKKPTAIVKFPVAMVDGRPLRNRPGSRSNAKREPTPTVQGALGTRRSSRISHDEHEPLVALSGSGKHEQITRASSTPEPSSARRPSRAGKGYKKPVASAILEVSHEDSVAGAASDEGDNTLMSGLEEAAAQGDPSGNTQNDDDFQMKDGEEQVVQESQPEPEDNDEDEGPVRATRSLRKARYAAADTPEPSTQPAGKTRRALRNKKSATEPSSDFEPDADADDAEAEADEDVSDSDELQKPHRGRSSNEGSATGRRSGRLAVKNTSQRSRSRRNASEEADAELDPLEIADEAAELDEDNRRNRRGRRRDTTRAEITFEPQLRNRNKRPDYRILRPELLLPIEDDDGAVAAAVTPQRNRRGGGASTYRSLFSTLGPFGGGGGPVPVLGGPEGTGALGGVDSDSSDEEGGLRGAPGVGGAIGMTPSSAFPKPYVPQALNADPVQGPGGGPPGLGKVKDKKALADADPLGVDTNVNFDGVGGLDGHIDQLKEMVMLPLLYPEVFQRFHITPPRGVLFHGPPGTGKTLLARALASSVSSHGQKVTFYMRKGADALSKWVGEAERQLRLLFEEARKTQPSIIFFDEIDGLAPVRSSKQEQIHASIVATLLALMDGMDGRGQVIVIGATNRPDSVDPALRRPGRFDREFYFPLPDQKGRRKILDIHTKGWDPPLKPEFKDQLAQVTQGYGGADLRALCTEAALNAVQGTYPQIYSSEQKLVINPATIKVLAKDFMISVNKMVPSSERSAASGAATLKKDIEPLLRKPLASITNLVDEIIPRKRKATALEEAMFDDRDDEFGFEKETIQREFEASRIFRPRLLIRGVEGMGQQYLGAALLSKFEGLHVQNFDLPTLLKDSTRSPEAAVVQLFEEVKRHKPSVIYIPNVNVWYSTLAEPVIKTFLGLLRGLAPTEPVLLLGTMSSENEDTGADSLMIRDLFGYSTRNQFLLKRPDEESRIEFFGRILELISKSPAEFPDPDRRKRRKLEQLPIAPTTAQQPKGPSKADLKAQKKKDRQTLNMLKLHIQTVMDQIKLKYKKFRTPVVDESIIGYLYDEQDPQTLTTDLDEARRQKEQLFRPYEIDKDEKGVGGLREVASGKFYYNLEIVTIEKRLSNGYYKRPKDFLADIKRLAKDAKNAGDQDRTLKANEMLANVEVDMTTLEQSQPALVAECEAVYQREVQRDELIAEKAKEAEQHGENVPRIIANVPPPHDSKQTSQTTGPVVLGQQVPGRPALFPTTPSKLPGPSPTSNAWSNTNGSLPSYQTNGSHVPSRSEEGGARGDSEMVDSPAGNAASHAHDHPQSGQSQTLQQNQAPPTLQHQGSTAHLSQLTAHTRIAQGSQVAQYQNSASTTTSSGQKGSSDRSDRSSAPISVRTNASNGHQHPQRNDHRGNQHQSERSIEYPDFSIMDPRDGSQLPDTQEPSLLLSQASQQMIMAPPSRTPRHSGSGSASSGAALNPISAVLNKDDLDMDVDEVDDDELLPHSSASAGNAHHPNSQRATKPGTSANSHHSASQDVFVLPDSESLQNFHQELVIRSSGLSLEQLEQVNAAMMHIIWRHKSLYDRRVLLTHAQTAFNDAIHDIEVCQIVGDPSQHLTSANPSAVGPVSHSAPAMPSVGPSLAESYTPRAPLSQPAHIPSRHGSLSSASVHPSPAAGVPAPAPGITVRRI